jgi:hypothetical protein
VLLLAPAGALVAAAFAAEPLLAHRRQTFMGNAARFVAQFFPLFLLGALFAKPMGDSGSVAAVADWMTRRLGAAVTCGGVSLFVAYLIPAPTAATLFRAAGPPRRLMPAAILVGSSTFTMSAVPGTPVIPNIIPAAFFGTTPFAAPSLGLIATAVMLDLGLRWLAREEAARACTRAGSPATVPVGQVVARLDPTSEENSLRVRRAEFVAAQAQLIEARNNYWRQQELLRTGFTTRVRFDGSLRTLQSAESSLDAARTQVDLAGTRLGYTELAADPVIGTFRVWLSLDNPLPALRLGSTVTGRMQIGGGGLTEIRPRH